MVFPYYAKLSQRQKKIYKKSDAITSIRLHDAVFISPLLNELENALVAEDRSDVEKISRDFIAALTKSLKVPPVRIKVLAVRPSNDWGELQGLYEPIEENKRACISVWMRTAKHKKVVAFRTFVRTLLHELCHHLDYEMLGLEDSFHTEGFFKRESSLFKQLVQ